jgi:hypothetical protein
MTWHLQAVSANAMANRAFACTHKCTRVCLTVTIHFEQVSDREWLATRGTTPALLEAAKSMMAAGKGEEILFRDYEGGNGTPVCARRFVSLAERGGDDDLFSSDFSDDELKVGNLSFQHRQRTSRVQSLPFLTT